MKRTALLTVAAMLASSYLAVGGALAWMIWPMTADKPPSERSVYVVELLVRWPAYAANTRKAVAK